MQELGIIITLFIILKTKTFHILSCRQSGKILILYEREKRILLYYMWNFEASNFEIRGDIFHFGRLSDKKFLRIGFGFHMTFHFFRYSKLCFPHFLFDIPNFVRRKIWSIGFHMTCHFFRFQGIVNIPSYVFHTLWLIYPSLSDEILPSIGFHKTCHIFRFQGVPNIQSYVFHTFCLIYTALSEEL